MSSHAHTLTADGFPSRESASSLRGWIVATGIAMLLFGTAAVIYEFTATIASVIVVGWLLLFAGIMQIVNAFQVRTWSGFFLYLLDGIIRATVGVLVLAYPQAGAEAITLVLAFFFVTGGLFKTFGSMYLKFPSWGWSVASGLISVVLGVALAYQWPAVSMWFIGFAVGIDLIIYGWTLLMFASAMKQLSDSFA
jgi:uncharacterized membrane protein HdeD (DUF308 family)